MCIYIYIIYVCESICLFFQPQIHDIANTRKVNHPFAPWPANLRVTPHQKKRTVVTVNPVTLG